MSISRPNLSPRYTIDAAGLTAAVSSQPGLRLKWEPMSAAMRLLEYTETPGFDLERICARCKSFDSALGVQPHQLKLPKLRAREMVKMKDLLPLPWEPAWPSEEVKLRPHQVERPGQAIDPHGCHMCLFSFLDPVPPPELSETEIEALKSDFRDARAEVSRLHQSRARETRPSVLEYTEQLLDRANARLRVVANACRDAGFEPFKPRSRREGDEAPDQVMTTVWEAEGGFAS